MRANQAWEPVLVDLCATTFIDVTAFRSRSLVHHMIGRQCRRFAVPAQGSVERIPELTTRRLRRTRYLDRFSAVDALRAPA